MGNLTISISPHLKGRNSTAKIMLDVIIAMLPAFAAGVFFFGLRALTVTAVTVAAAVLSEFLFEKLCKRDITVGDLSAVVTGIILAMNFPVSIPYWQAALGSVIAIVVVKQLFGGIGFNFANPASTARIVLLSSFGSTLSHWVAPKDISFTTMNMADLTTSATPMANIPVADATVPSLSDMLIGNIGGSIGETCSIAIIIGLVYLIARRVITPHIPLVIIGTVFVLGLFLAPEVISSSINVTGIKNVDYAIYNLEAKLFVEFHILIILRFKTEAVALRYKVSNTFFDKSCCNALALMLRVNKNGGDDVAVFGKNLNIKVTVG